MEQLIYLLGANLKFARFKVSFCQTWDDIIVLIKGVNNIKPIKYCTELMGNKGRVILKIPHGILAISLRASMKIYQEVNCPVKYYIIILE